MLSRSCLITVLSMFTIFIVLSAEVHAQHSLTGEIGIDLEQYNFGAVHKNDNGEYSISRARSAHFIKMDFNGPVVNNKFATYAVSTFLGGTYFDSRSSEFVSQDYVDPSISAYFSQLTLLPTKKYPLLLFKSNTENYTLRYEQSNRSDRNRLRPALAVVRRYKRNMNSTGAVWRYTPAEFLNFSASYTSSSLQSVRIYDFAEDKDLEISTMNTPTFITDTLLKVSFKNNYDGPVTIVIINEDSLLQGHPLTMIIDSIPSMEKFDTLLFPGFNEITINAAGLNSFREIRYIDSNLNYTIKLRDPSSPKDSEQETDEVLSILELGGAGRISNATTYRFADSRDLVTKLGTIVSNIDNQFAFEFSRKLKANMSTTASTSTAKDESQPDQISKSFDNMATMNFSQRRGISAIFSHGFSKSSSENERDSLRFDTLTPGGSIVDTVVVTYIGGPETKLTNLGSIVSYASNRFNHVFGMLTNYSTTSSSVGGGDSRISTELTNKGELMLIGVELKPATSVQLSSMKRTDPDESSTGLTAQLLVDATLPPSEKFGEIKFKTDIGYQRQSGDNGSNIKKYYQFDGTLAKEFSKSLKLEIMTSQKIETYGGSIPVAGENADQKSPAKEPEYRAFYRLGLKGKPFHWMLLSGTYSHITSAGTALSRYGLSLNAEIPKIGLPLKMFFNKDVRNIGDLEPQSTISLDTKITYSIRKIKITIEHSYKKENQIFDVFTNHEIRAKISRQFGLY